MNLELKERFLVRWRQYFPQSELPITFEYVSHPQGAERAVPTAETRCLIAALKAVRSGRALYFDAGAIGCGGGRFYAGFAAHLRAGIEEFLSCDAAGEGERYKKSPQLAGKTLAQVPHCKAAAPYLLFKRWDLLTEADAPAAVIFFVAPDALSGLFTLANFDEEDAFDAVIAPFGAGCATIIQYPLHEARRANPRAILGLFDVSARPHVASETLTFAVPIGKFARMVDNMDESFLITESWAQVRDRMQSRQ